MTKKDVLLTNGTQRVFVATQFTSNSSFVIYNRTSSTIDYEITNIQVEVGTKANHYTPYGTTPIKMCDIGDYEDGFVRTSGKNLFDGELEQGGIAYQDGAEESVNDRVRTKNYIEVEPNTNYTLKRYNVNNTQLGLRFYDKNKNYIGFGSATTGAIYNFTTKVNDNDVYYVRWIDLENNLII